MNVVIVAHPSKTDDAWWYGVLVQGGRKGFFPQTYVEVIQKGTFLKLTHILGDISWADEF